MDRRLREIMTPQALEGFIRELEAIWEGRESQVMEKHYRTLARGDVHMRVTWSVERVDGRPDYSQARMVFTDITDIRRAEAALQASEERYRRLFAATPNPLYIFDAESLRILAVNDAAVERYGHAREDFLRLTVLDLRPEEDVPRFRATMERRRGEFGRSDGPMAAGLWRHRTRDGRVLTVEVFTHNLLFQDRRCVLVLPIDVTAKLEAERALRASEARYRELVENAAVGVYRSTPDGRFIAVNPALARIYGFETPDEMLRWNEREHAGASYADTDEHRRFTELIERHGRVEGFESQVTDRHGRLVWVSETSRAVRDEQGRLLHYEGFVTDITERRRLEAELLRASKLEAVGILAGGIAHDFNNILTVILGNVTLAEFDAGAAPGLRPMLQEAKRATLRARDLTQQLLTFAKGGDPVREAVALADIVRESAEFGMHGAKSRLELDLPGDLWPANADKGQLAQVVQNLVINAVQAMPDGGVVRIAAANAALGAGEVAGLAAGDYIRLTVRDTGTGIPPEHLPKIFDPYFTTKQQGSGLGLATVYSIVRKHQGAIVVDSELGAGSIFRFWLPALRSVAPRTEAASAEARPLSGRVLFLDDEEPIREMAVAYLARLGVDCVAVPDGAAAVREFRAAQATDRPFRLLVLDLTVPGGMGGLETLGVLRGLDPAIRAVVSSGYSQDPVMGNFRGFGFNAVLVKPYDLDQLGRVVAASLGRTAD
jgi:PAS domain S-box-containing protein